MSILPILPQGFVVGRILTSRGDSADADKKADTAVVVGFVDFTPSTDYRKLDAATVVTHSKIAAKLDSHGDLHPQRETFDNTGSDTEDGIWLPTGTWKVTYRLNTGMGALPEHHIEVTTAHTEAAPLPLFANLGDPAPAGATFVQLSVPLGGQQGQVLVMNDGSLSWGTPSGGGSSTIAADDTPAAPAEGESASYLVTSAVVWPAGLVWSTDPDGGVAPTITGSALVSLFTLGGVTRAIMGATFPVVAPESPLADAILALSPVGYWRLDETAGTQATDYSGNARHGTYGGDYTLAANGGLVTLGATGYVDCGDADEWSYAGAADGFTVFALATRPSIPSSASAFMGKRGAGNAEWMAFLSGGANAGKMTFGGYTIDGSKVCTEERADSALTDIGSWNAYAFAAQPPSRNARVAMYENGRLLTSSNVGGTVNTFSNGAASLRIGGVEYSGWGSNTFLPWNGSIGHVAVFRSTLTAGQVATLAAAAATEGLI